MKSPFPGMDPYLERHWPDVHAALVIGARSDLNNALPADLVARSEERLAIESPDSEFVRSIAISDVNVFKTAGGIAVASKTTFQAPYKLVLDFEPLTEHSIRIIRPSDDRLITVIEFISPSNKTSPGLEKFLENRRQLLHAGVHFLEIDLVRRGNWRELLLPHLCPKDAETPYRAIVRLGGDERAAYLFPMSLRQPLPAIPIPLRPGDPELKLDLQKLVADAYSSGRYDRTLNYSKPCDPPLNESDSQWVRELVKSQK
jgi:hypothetical protein